MFSKKDIELSKRIVGKFEEFSPLLAVMRTAQRSNKKEGEWIVYPNGGIETNGFFDLLEKNDIPKVKFIQVKNDAPKGKQWKPFKREWLKTSNPDQSLFLSYQLGENRDGINLLAGDWLTAVVTDVVGDHLRRNEIEHEIFSKVAYQGPIELGSARSDFDVIALRVGAREAYGFECKSGKILETHVDEVVKKGNTSRVFSKISPTESTACNCISSMIII